LAEQKYFELERQQIADHSRLETEAKAATELRWQVSDLGLYVFCGMLLLYVLNGSEVYNNNKQIV